MEMAELESVTASSDGQQVSVLKNDGFIQDES